MNQFNDLLQQSYTEDWVWKVKSNVEVVANN